MVTFKLLPGSVPALYREIFDICSHNSEPIHKEVFHCLLSQCKLDSPTLKTIWDLCAVEENVSRTNLYKALALVAWAQQGKTVSDKLFHNFTGKGK